MGDHQTDKQRRKEEEEGSQMKICVQCGATKTPLWRNGPAGPKSLCNACGIKSRKKRGSPPILSGTKSSTEEKKLKKLITNSESTTSSSSSSNGNNNCKSSQSPKKKLVPLGQEVVFQKSMAERLRRRLGEDEKAAMLLLSLSCGSVY